MTIADYYTASDSAILATLGERIRDLRLRKNITQEALAERTLLSVGTIKSLETGKGKLSTLVAVLRELGTLEQLDQFIPPITISPLRMVEANARQPAKRKRARAMPDKVKSK
jgi:transcriptional regulator with XRE-family HTH domain